MSSASVRAELISRSQCCLCFILVWHWVRPHDYQALGDSEIRILCDLSLSQMNKAYFRMQSKKKKTLLIDGSWKNATKHGHSSLLVCLEMGFSYINGSQEGLVEMWGVKKKKKKDLLSLHRRNECPDRLNGRTHLNIWNFFMVGLM